jgi:hypothetical protein
MQDKPSKKLEAARRKHPALGDSPKGEMFGYFCIQRPGKQQAFQINIISSGHNLPGNEGWEHVSVSVLYQNNETRCPSWLEMVLVKHLFWDDEETVIQFHPKKSRYVNECDTCLHLWKKTEIDHELPPGVLL